MRNAQYFNQGNSQTSDYFVGNIQYDRNGNITHLERNASGSNLQMDVLDYHYNSTKNNQLDYVSDAVSNTSVLTYDLDNQSAGNYVYDDLGQLKDDVEGGKYMDYNSYGLITKVYSDASRTTPIMENVYDANGFRMSKITYDIVNSGIASKTHYVRSSSGSLLGVYEELYSGGASQGIEFSEVPIVGNSRIGTYQIPINRVVYELNDHIGNVRAVVTRDLTDNSSEVLSYSDYYPFGMKMPGRSLNRNDYRYGYQGQFTEHDTETDWDYFEARNYDSKLARWMSIDPAGQFHSYYLAMANQPHMRIDPDGRAVPVAAVIIAAAAFGLGNLAIQSSNNEIDNFGDGVKAFGAGAVTGAALVTGFHFALQVPVLAATIKGAGWLAGGTSALSFAFGYGEAMVTGDFTRFMNSNKTILGNTYLDGSRSFFGQVLQGASRFTWELPTTAVGQSISQVRNIIGQVDRVDYFGGATFATGYNNIGGGFSVGNNIGINTSTQYPTNMSFHDYVSTRPLLMHEYGHTFDSQKYGPGYFLIAGASLLSYSTAQNNLPGEPSFVSSHKFMPWEMSANIHAKRYFGKHYGVDWDNDIYNSHTLETRMPTVERSPTGMPYYHFLRYFATLFVL